MKQRLTPKSISFTLFLITCLLLVTLLPVGTQRAQAVTTAKYIIIFQGDGMAPEHIKAGGMYVNGAAGTLVFQSFTNATTMTHNNASGSLTDSAASATAMATGVKVNNGVISVALPGNGSELTSLLEIHRDSGRSTGLVTISFMTDASPAAYGAHETSRNNTAAIFNDYMVQTRPNVVLGGGGNGYNSATAVTNGYTTVSDRASLLALDTEIQTRVAGGFGSGLIPAEGMAGRSSTLPTLPEMTQTALNILDNDPDGFFAFIEHEGIDEYSHANNAANLMLAMKEFNAAVQKAIDWVNLPGNDTDWSNTLIVVLGDHETGGLQVTETTPTPGEVPAVTWSTTGHTTTPVAVYAQGNGAEQITGVQIDNTSIFSLLIPASGPTPTPTSSPTPDPAVSVSFQNSVLPDITYTGNEDTTLSQANAAANYGAAVDLLVDGDDPPGSGNDLSALLRWDISLVPPGSQVQTVSLTLNVFNTSANSYSLYELKQDWVESQATWNLYSAGSPWQATGAQGANDRGTTTLGNLIPTSVGQYVINLNTAGISVVQAWVDNPPANHGMIFANASNTDGMDMDSSEAATLMNRPKLTIRYLPGLTPTPTSLPTETPTPTVTDTPTATPTPSDTPTPTATATETSTPTLTNTPTPTNTPTSTATFTPTPQPEIIYVSSSTGGTAGGISFEDEDILAFDKNSRSWALHFDGSDVGVGGTDLDAIDKQPDGSILMSFDSNVTLSGIGAVTPQDIVRFTPTSLGSTTAGTFTWYFDGSDVGLSTSAENIDALAITSDGKVVISTTGNFSVTGASGEDEDLIAFSASQLGSTTAGTWAIYFDGSDVALNTTSNEDVNGAWIDPLTGKVYLTTLGAFSVSGVSGDGADIFICTPGTLGSTTTCTFAMYWDGSVNGFSGEVADAIEVVIPTK